jgi:hypothetical protein
MKAPSTLTDQAISSYHELIDTQWKDVHEAVLRETEERAISFLGRSVVRTLRPYFLDEATYQDIRRATLVVGQALDQLAERVAQTPALRRLLGLTDRDEHYLASEPFLRAPFARLDGFLGQDGVLRFLEYNAHPFGTIYTEMVAELFTRLPIMAELGQRYPMRYLRTSALLGETLRNVNRERVRSERMNIAVVAGEAGNQNVALTEGLHLMKLAMQGGAGLRVVPPEAVVSRDDGLWADDYPIDCLAVTDANECHSHFPAGHGVWTALRQRQIWLLGSQAPKVAQGNKGMFALLTGPECQGMFDVETEATLRRHLPWTRMVRDGRTDFHGETIDLLPFINRHRERFALKPTIGYGGKGVVLGWVAEQADWDATVAHAAEGPYVVQERVPARLEPFPCVLAGALDLAPRHVDFDPYYWDGRLVDGALVRISDADLLNITSGFGSLAPLFILGERG